MHRRRLTVAMAAAALALAPSACLGQNAEPLAVGDAAPEFAITGSTRHGVLRDPVRLSDYRGETVVLSFFYRARTPG
jgi:poly(3-hydroxybutyrate) depolymerase